MELMTVIDHVRKGNKEEFRHIIRKCNQPLFRTALMMLRNEGDAEDAVQTTYLKAFLHLSSYREEASFLTWITRILINECKMILRRRRMADQVGKQVTGEDESREEKMMENLDKQQMREWLEAAVVALPEKYRLVYILREVNELSTGETAAALEISEENVKVRLHRAKALVRDTLLKNTSVREIFPFAGQRCDRLTERVMVGIVSLNSEN